MGCGSSKLNSAEEVVPAKIRPLLRGYEEMKKRRQRPGTTMHRESTLSKKKLLKEDEDTHSDSSIEAETVYNSVVTSPRKVEPAKVVPLPDSEWETRADIENHNGNTEQRNQEKEKDAEDKNTQEVVETAAENEHEGVDEKNDDNDDGDDFDFGRLVCPGSPSFRIYCAPAQDDKEESKSQEMVTHQKSDSVESVQSPPSGHLKTSSVDSIQSAASSENSKISNESAETQPSIKRRRNKKKKLQAVKNLLIVKSFYASCACTGIDRNRLLAAKAAN